MKLILLKYFCSLSILCGTEWRDYFLIISVSSEAAARRPARPTGQFPTVPSCAEAQHEVLYFSSSIVQRRILVFSQSFRETLCSVGFDGEQKRFLHHQK